MAEFKETQTTESVDAPDTINLPTYEQSEMLKAFIKSMPRVVVKEDDNSWYELYSMEDNTVYKIRMYLFVERFYNTLDGFQKDVEDFIETKLGIPKNYFLLSGIIFSIFEPKGKYDRILLQINFYTN